MHNGFHHSLLTYLHGFTGIQAHYKLQSIAQDYSGVRHCQHHRHVKSCPKRDRHSSWRVLSGLDRKYPSIQDSASDLMTMFNTQLCKQGLYARKKQVLWCHLQQGCCQLWYLLQQGCCQLWGRLQQGCCQLLCRLQQGCWQLWYLLQQGHCHLQRLPE